MSADARRIARDLGFDPGDPIVRATCEALARNLLVAEDRREREAPRAADRSERKEPSP